MQPLSLMWGHILITTKIYSYRSAIVKMVMVVVVAVMLVVKIVVVLGGDRVLVVA